MNKNTEKIRRLHQRGGLKSFKELGVLLALVALCIVIGLINPVFFSPNNLLNVLRQISMLGIVAVGGAMVIITGGIDLSAGTMIALGGILCAWFVQLGLNAWLAMLASIAACAILGTITSSLFIVKLRITPFIATLAMMDISKGITFMITRGVPISFKTSLDFIGGTIGPIPVSVIIMFVVMIIGYIVLEKTEFGRKIYALGGNERAAILSGVRVNRIKISVYAIISGLCALAGIIAAANVSSAVTSSGNGYELEVIAAVVIGGASLSGGRGSILGVLLGACILGVIKNGFVLLMIPNYWQYITTGVVIVIACALDEFRRSRSN